MADITDATFDAEVLQSPIPVLVDFWAPWCGPCKSMLPVVEEVSSEYEGKVKVVKVNVDENSDTPQKFGVMSIPAFFIFKNGEVANSFVGVKTKDFLKEELDKVLEA
jgi:thioredoxin 1